jgi:hypothetical protein
VAGHVAYRGIAGNHIECLHFRRQIKRDRIYPLLADIEIDQLIPLACRADKSKRRRTGAGYRDENIVIIGPRDLAQLDLADAGTAQNFRLGGQRNDHQTAVLAAGPHKREFRAIRRNCDVFQGWQAAKYRQRNCIGSGGGMAEKCQGGGKQRLDGDVAQLRASLRWNIFLVFLHPCGLLRAFMAVAVS